MNCGCSTNTCLWYDVIFCSLPLFVKHRVFRRDETHVLRPMGRPEKPVSKPINCWPVLEVLNLPRPLVFLGKASIDGEGATTCPSRC